MLLEGLHIPLTTPFHADGRLALNKLASNVARYSKSPAAGLIVLGPSGEPSLLSDGETCEVLRTAAGSAAPEKVLIAGISRDSVRATLTLAEFAAEHDYDAIVVSPPAAVSATARSGRRHEELLFFFRAVAEASPLPLILGETTIRTSLHELFPTLAAHPNIIGSWVAHRHTFQFNRGIARRVQQAASVARDVTVTTTFAAVTARMKKAARADSSSLISASALGATSPSATVAAEAPATSALRTRTKTVGFQVLAGDSRSLLDSLRSGAISIAPAFAAAAPQACYEIFAAFKDSDHALADEKQARLIAAAQLAEASPAALKYAADLNGYFGGLPRLPHLPLSAAEREALEAAMRPLRN